jgi:TonB family protein
MQAVDGLGVAPVPWTLTDADRLNKIDWIGELVLTANAWRDVRQPNDQTGDPLKWQATHSGRHQTAEEVRTRQADIEGTCTKCVSVANQFESIGAYREAGAWHFFVSQNSPEDLYRDFASGRYTIVPSPGPAIDLPSISSAKPACSSIPETPEYKEAARKAEQEAAAAAALAERQAAEAAELRRQQISAAAQQSRTPQTDLEKKTKADGYWEDPDTGLMWVAGDNRQSCTTVHIGSQSDWRVADVYELQSISDKSQSHDLIYQSEIATYHIAGGIMLSQPLIWAAHVDAPAPATVQGQPVRNGTALKSARLGPRPNVWVFDFRSGERSIQPLGFVPDDVLCVRGTARKLKTEEGIVQYDETAPAPKAGGAAAQSKPQAVVNPAIVSQATPEYSQEARAKRVAGTVVLSAVIDTHGRLKDIRILQPLGSGLDEKAVEAVRKWVYTPATLNGLPVNVLTRLEINFRL